VDVLRRLFSLDPTSGSRLSKLRVTVRDVSVHGATALAIVSDGRLAQASRFVRSASGRWLIDCCTAAQANRLARRIYRVPSVGMEPTLKPGQLVAADNIVLRSRAPAVGEVVTLHPPVAAACRDPRQGDGFQQPCGAPAQSASTEVLIKRVVGIRGDRIALVGGRLVRNGMVQDEPYILACGGALCDFPKPVVVPPGTYYVLGDNRGNSLDSRFYGPVPRSSILGVLTP
jgi:signal peptidase I